MTDQPQKALKITFWRNVYTTNESFRKVIIDSQKRIFDEAGPGAAARKCFIQFPHADKVLANSVYRRLRQAAPNGVFKDWNK